MPSHTSVPTKLSLREEAIKDVEGALDRILAAQQYGEIHIQVKPGPRIIVEGRVSNQYPPADR
jgi:hypothetical protein